MILHDQDPESFLVALLDDNGDTVAPQLVRYPDRKWGGRGGLRLNLRVDSFRRRDGAWSVPLLSLPGAEEP